MKYKVLIPLMLLVLALPFVNAFTGSGGTTYIDGDSTVHVFRANGTFIVTDGGNVSVLLIGGGGGGGNAIGGGGGAGGLNFTASINIPTGVYQATIGSGGWRADGTTNVGNDGAESRLNISGSIFATGGGAGNSNGNSGVAGRNGGSGGGGGGGAGAAAGGTGLPGQGNNGGVGGGAGNAAGGGGGGAGSVGADAVGGVGGNGGGGRNLTINGSLFCYAGGGGGGANGGTDGTASCGGGDAGVLQAGTNGTGGGGGGSIDNNNLLAGNGAFGIIIIRYKNAVIASPVLSINGSINDSSIFRGDVINVSFNATANYNLSFGQITINDTGVTRTFSFALNNQTPSQFSQNFTISCAPCVVNITGIINDSNNNFAQNSTLYNINANIIINATDLYDGEKLNNFSVNFSGGPSGSFNVSTENGLISIGNISNGVYDLRFSSFANGGYLEYTYSNVNIAGQSFTGQLYQVEVLINASEVITGIGIPVFNVRVPGQSNTSRALSSTSSVSESLVSSSFESQNCANGDGGLSPAIDGDWDTYTYGGTVYENYTNPNNLDSARILFKGGAGAINAKFNISCFDGSDYIVILNESTTASYDNRSRTLPTNCLSGSVIQIKTFAQRVGVDCSGGIGIGGTARYYESSINYTISQNGQARLLLKRGSYNITGGASGYLNTTNETLFLPYSVNYMTLNFGTNQLKIAAKNIFSNQTINTFSITLIGLNVSFSNTQSTTNGNVTFNVLNGNYTAVFTSPTNAIYSQNITVNTQLQNETLLVYPLNSIFIRIYNLSTGLLLINNTVTAGFSSTLSVFNLSTFNATMLAESVMPGSYSITFTSTGYTTRTYFVDLLDSSNIILNTYLSISGDTTSKTLSILDERTTNPINGVLVSVSQRINLTYVTIVQKYTDISGDVQFDLSSSQQYRFTLSKGGYETRTFDLTPANSQYTIYLTPETEVDFTTIYNLVDFVTYPVNSIITQLGNINFSILTASLSGISLDYFGLTTTINGTTYFSNLSTSPGGGTSFVTINLSQYDYPYSFDVIYFIQVDGQDYFQLNRTFYFNPSLTGNNTVISVIDDWKNQLPPLYLSLFAVVVILIVVVSFRSAGATGRAMNLVAGATAGVLGYYGIIPKSLSITMMVILIGSFFILNRVET